MAARKHVGSWMGLLQQRCTGRLPYVLALLQAAGTLALMFYALWWEFGNLVNLPDKCIGFYNFCLFNETAGELQCLNYMDLQAMGISILALAIARVFVYACLVISLFYPIFVAHVYCAEQREGWKTIIIILIIKMIILSGGLGIFLLQTSPWIHPSDFTGGFLALLGAQALLLLQVITTTMYLSLTKHTRALQSPAL